MAATGALPEEGNDQRQYGQNPPYPPLCANVQTLVIGYRRAGVALAVQGKTIIRMPRSSFCLA
jgi:hypothetical protein